MNPHQYICPICNSNSSILREIDSVFIQSKLEKYYGEKIEDSLSFPSYKIRRCNSCSLEFASPMKAGEENFYTWITKHKTYYPDSRWEWDAVIKEVHNHNLTSPVNLLEIGCGTGKFLKLAQQNGIKVVGLDTTPASVEICRKEGLEVYSSAIEDYLAHGVSEQLKFDYIVAFHCLEHVDNPKGLVKSMLSAVKPTGSIFLSTPYSPMSFETIWFDPLNYPPHHLTRWNAKSYSELAKQLGLNTKFIMPPAPKLIARVLSTLNYAWNGPANLVGRRHILLAALSKPRVTVIEIFRQLNREKLNNKVAADVVLVELKTKN
ncbi:MAG: class I SAM-dependent methyltransferase [Nostoc sp.]|uniref:class I SAM-dependent methyltransferase n=1 Tax=Nostoc sp. TaxID=1180 RepID=UPI002FF58799